jgi:murein DD-endopeptidase MepM/ murein hydrolase activator NlpD
MLHRSHRVPALAALLLSACIATIEEGEENFEGDLGDVSLVGEGDAEAAATAGPQPIFQLPFPGGEAWTGDADDSSAHTGNEIDFNKVGTSGDGDKGEAVVAAAAGTVITSSFQTNNGFGNLIVLDHGGGWRTFYAHLSARFVGVGDSVAQGEEIGAVGDTSASFPGGQLGAHLHFEVRNIFMGSYPANVRPARFDRITFDYSGDARQNLTSRNFGDDPEALCGAGFDAIDTAYLDAAGTHHGTVYLLFNGSSNCVVTVKHRARGTATTTSAYVEPQGASRVTDSGSFFQFAGPVKKLAPGCVKWGGAAGGVAFNSPFEHCS